MPTQTFSTPQATASQLTVALIGNPNTGKSTLFSALCGVHQRVGNYPGVTVEKKLGVFRFKDREITLVDLPGTYSLAPRAPDEMIAVDVLLGRRADLRAPDAILCIVDASNLERNLYLVSQVLELGRPVVLALNMTDVAVARGISIDVPELSRRLGVPVVETQAHRGRGIQVLQKALGAVASRETSSASPFPEVFQDEVRRLGDAWAQATGHRPPRYLVERLLLDTTGYMEQVLLPPGEDSLHQRLREARAALASAGFPVPAVEAMARYQWVARVLEGVVERAPQHRVAASDRLDAVLTHKLWGTLIFVLLMGLMFQSVFSWATPLMEGIDTGIAWLGDRLVGWLPEGALRSLLQQGVVAGVGSVLVFLPQIAILFFFIALLEDCGYMARAAYLMDKLMANVGLSGKSFIPLLSSFACAIPAVMAARVIENARDRLVTILIAPLMSCSARLPVYTLMIAAFVPATTYLGGWVGLQGLTLFAMYSIGIVAAIVVAALLKRTILAGPTPPFVLELPSYKIPSPSMVLLRMVERSWAFVRRAGTLILAVSIVVWAATYYPHDRQAVEGPYQARLASLSTERMDLNVPEDRRASLEREIQRIENEIAGEYQRQSWLGRMGHWIEPVVRPLGWDWRIGAAAIASFPAREVVVGTLGVIFNVGRDAEERSLAENLKRARWSGTDRPLFTIPTAFSLMVFFALCAQCASTLVIMRRETNSWKWPLFTFIYMTSLAYVAAMVTYQVGIRLP